MPMEINQDLQDARSLLEQSGTDDEKRKYRKAAEIILLKALHLDPENKEAKVLLQSARAMSGTLVAAPLEPTQERPSNPELELFKDLQPKAKKKWSLKLPMGLTVVALLGGGLLWMLQSHPGNRITLAASAERIKRVNKSNFQPAVVQDVHGSDFSPAPAPIAAAADQNPQPAEPKQVELRPVEPKPVEQKAVEPKPVASKPVEPKVEPKPVPVATAVVPPKPTTPPPETPRRVSQPEVGTLAVSSPTAADIYQNGQLIGSTPTTLQLPAGQHTLEYRHGELRAVVTHQIKPNETTPASVTFDITVQINARPWAQVFLDGSTRRPLGQTPLSGVSVPIGGTLVFENPNFPPKSHRITEKDSSIQLNFP
jgi:hypothetical protein